jgi:hypothetical protein
MEQTQQQALTERLILLSETCADLRIKLECSISLHLGAKCVLTGAAAEQWHKTYNELLQEVAK